MIAQANNPVVDNLLRAGAVVLGRTNTPAFRSLVHQQPAARRYAQSAQCAHAWRLVWRRAVAAAGIGHTRTAPTSRARYPAYACGVHGLRPTLGRVAAFNAALPERSLGGQITAVSGPLAQHRRLAPAGRDGAPDRGSVVSARAAGGAGAPKRVALCFYPDGLETEPAVVKALQDAARRLGEAGWRVDTLDAIRR